MKEIANQIFLGCNYNDKKIKNQFDNLKKRIEKTTPLHCVILDKRKGKQAKDIWKDLKSLIESSAIYIFDVTGFRPNVVLELGYTLSIKAEEQIFITFRKRKYGGKMPQWLLSDIAHLNHFDYIHMKELEKHIREQIEQTLYGSNFSNFSAGLKDANAGNKYLQKGLEILQKLRDKGPQSDRQIKQIMVGPGCRFETLTKLLKQNKLVSRSQGPNGKFSIPELDNAS